MLEEMRVLDLSVWRPMPHATQILADLGAEVLKVEPPGGDPMRGYPEIFASVARGKRSIVLDLKTDAGRDRALALAGAADVVCEGWRPGVAARLGLDLNAVTAVNPTVIYCSVSGYGQDGPWRDVPGHDVNFQALAGALATGGERSPDVPSLPVADLEAGTVAALVICAAWARRLSTGLGERIDVAMTDVVHWWVGTRSGTAHAEQVDRLGGSPGYGTFRARDGRWLALGVLGEQRLWDATCGALALTDLVGLAFVDRLTRTEEVNARIAEAIGRLDVNQALATLLEHGAPVSPVLSPEEASHHQQLDARGFHVETAAGPVAAFPARHGPAGARPDRIPAVGEHQEQPWSTRA
ncbi:MAG: CoA transferase [Acidimicrobiia bacterium]